MFSEMSISGNGKDCQFMIRTSEPEKIIHFEMRDPSVHVDIQGKIITKSFNYGDLDLGLKYLPSEDIIILTAEIDYPGDDEEWLESLERFNQGCSDSIHWMIRDVKVVLAKHNR